jgi:hypothetical protein
MPERGTGSVTAWGERYTFGKIESRFCRQQPTTPLASPARPRNHRPEHRLPPDSRRPTRVSSRPNCSQFPIFSTSFPHDSAPRHIQSRRSDPVLGRSNTRASEPTHRRERISSEHPRTWVTRPPCGRVAQRQEATPSAPNHRTWHDFWRFSPGGRVANSIVRRVPGTRRSGDCRAARQLACLPRSGASMAHHAIRGARCARVNKAKALLISPAALVFARPRGLLLRPALEPPSPPPRVR